MCVCVLWEGEGRGGEGGASSDIKVMEGNVKRGRERERRKIINGRGKE